MLRFTINNQVISVSIFRFKKKKKHNIISLTAKKRKKKENVIKYQCPIIEEFMISLMQCQVQYVSNNGTLLIKKNVCNMAVVPIDQLLVNGDFKFVI